LTGSLPAPIITVMGLDFLSIAVLLIIGIIILVAVTLMVYGVRKRGSRKDRNARKDRDTRLRDANKTLSQDPRNAEALQTLAEVYFEDGAWEKALKTYGALISLCATNPDISEFEVSLRYGLAAVQLKQYEEAYKSLVVANSLKPDVFEVISNLGLLEYRRKNYEKAATTLKKALEQRPEHTPTMRTLGLTLTKTHKPKDAVSLLRKVLELEPEDKETLFALAGAYYELNANDQAVRIYTHLRPDPVYGPHSALIAGTIHLKSNQFEKAEMDFELGLRHEKVRPDVLIELRYRLAASYVKQQKVQQAVPILQQVYEMNPDYKDVRAQISRYQALSRDRNLQIFLMAPSSEFVGLCRKIVLNFFPQSKVKITDISVQQNEYADVLAEIETSKWEDLILFRFIRTSGQVGELMLRDLHSRIKDLKAGRGFCLAAGEYSPGAKQFVEARLIDLIDKEELPKALRKADA